MLDLSIEWLIELLLLRALSVSVEFERTMEKF